MSDGRAFRDALFLQGTALMQFYMHILNFLARENDRRESVPYLEYAGRMTEGWKSLRPA